MTQRLFIFVGHSGAGKTTYIERLIPELRARGLRVATLKHAHHKVALDHEGKDSWRHKQAGAEAAMLVTAGALQLVADLGDGPEREPAALAARFFPEADIVLAEGFSHAPGAKIEILRAACARPPRCTPADGLVAMVSDCADAHPELPHFALDDCAALADFLLACPA